MSIRDKRNIFKIHKFFFQLGGRTCAVIFILLLVSCKTEQIEPINFKENNQRINQQAKSIYIIAQMDTLARYQLKYDAQGDLIQLEEKIGNRLANTSTFTYNLHQLKTMQWKGFVDAGVYGTNISTTSNYIFEYDSLQRLVQVTKAIQSYYNETQMLKLVEKPEYHQLLRLDMGNGNVDYLKEIKNESTQVIDRYFNKFYQNSYSEIGDEVRTNKQNSTEVSVLKKSGLENKLNPLFWFIIQGFVESGGDILSSKQKNFTNLSAFCFFDNYVKNSYSKYPYSYNDFEYRYTLDSYGNLLKISLLNSSVKKEILFVY